VDIPPEDAVSGTKQMQHAHLYGEFLALFDCTLFLYSPAKLFLYFCAVMKCCMKTGVYAYTSDLISQQVSKTFIKCIRHIK